MVGWTDSPQRAPAASTAAEPPLRRDILAVVQEHPGIHKSALCRAIGCGWGTVGHHLVHLERAGLVDVAQWNHRTVAFPAGVESSRRAWFAAYRADLGGPILRHLLGHGRQDLHAVAGAIGRSPRATREHLRTLQGIGLVEREGVHRPRYRLTEQGRRFMDGGGS